VRIARVFPKRTSFSPIDNDAYFGPPDLFTPKYDEVHVSCLFTWDKPTAERLAQNWQGYGEVKIGGPAYGDRGGEFTPNMYTGNGCIITSRGCPMNCPWCHVPKREGRIRHLEIKEGNILQDNNILACNKDHKDKVWAMLRKQKNVSLRGGIDARLLKDSDVERIRGLHLADLWTAYDDKENKKASLSAITRLREAGISQNKIRCYVLVGFGDEGIEDAEDRLKECYQAGALPFAQLYDGYNGDDIKEWKRFARRWSRPAIYKSMIKDNIWK
jgi:hypothetical protein